MGGNWPKEEDIKFRNFLINEGKVTSVFGYNEEFEFIPRNEFNGDENKRFKYDDQLITLITLLVDPEKTADEIQIAAANFKVVENVND